MSVRSKAVCRLATAGADARMFAVASTLALVLSAVIAYGLSV